MNVHCNALDYVDWFGWVCSAWTCTRSNIGCILGWFGLYKRLQGIAIITWLVFLRSSVDVVMSYGLGAQPDKDVSDRLD